MKLNIVLIVLPLLMSFKGISQLAGWQDKVTWTYSVEKINDHQAYIVATAKLKSGWHVFSVNHDPNKADLTGYPTTFVFKGNENFKPIGKAIDGKKAEIHNDDLGTSLYFEGTGVFKQKVEILTKDKFVLNFKFSFQICDENGCLFPPDQEGKVTISGFTPEDLNNTSSELKINGDYATDSDGIHYVQFNNEWIVVPEGNSPKFYKNYLELGGKHEQ